MDVELLLGLGRGMTAWLPEITAIRQVLHDFLLVAETVRWAQPNWHAQLLTFPADAGDDHYEPQATRTGADDETLKRQATPMIALFPECVESAQLTEARTMNPRESMMPSFSLSEEGKARLIWLSQETRTSLDQAVTILIQVYRFQQAEGYELDDLRAIVRLREQCEATEVSIEELRHSLELQAALREADLSAEEAASALSVADDLSAAGLSLEEAQQVAELMRALEEAGVNPTIVENLQAALNQYRQLGYEPTPITRLAELASRLQSLEITPEDLEERLQHLERVAALGLDLATTERLAAALQAVGAVGERGEAVLAQIVQMAGVHVDVAALQAQKDTLEQDVRRLEGARAEAQQALDAVQTEISQATEHVRALTQRLQRLHELCDSMQGAVESAQVFEGFLLAGNPAHVDAFWERVARLHTARIKVGGVFPDVEARWTGEIRQQVFSFLQRIARGLAPPSTPASS